MKTVVIVGGGISGLVASFLIAKAGIPCTVVEKKNYPQHRVCGEYVSNEALPFLKSHKLLPEEKEFPRISRFMLTSVKGKQQILPLDPGGFGISRYFFDRFLFESALSAGVNFALNTTVENVEFSGQSFIVHTSGEVFNADVVLGCFGKRSNLDLKLNRNFTHQRSPYVGVKYHVRWQHPSDLIALHNFPGGYCGVSPIEDNKVNLCYLVHRDKLRGHKSIERLQERELCINPLLREIFRDAEFLLLKPETINEISFQSKSTMENHMLMAGDSAGMITPLCGNGIAMAIHSAKIISEAVIPFLRGEISRSAMEKQYSTTWSNTFGRRLFVGRQIQNLFGSETASGIAINIALYFRPLAMEMIRNTHGSTF